MASIISELIGLLDFFQFFLKKIVFFYEYFSFSLTWDPMGANISKPTPLTNCGRKFSNFPEISSQWSSQNDGVFEILKIEILMIFLFFFVNMGPFGSESFKTLLLQIPAEVFKPFLKFLPHGPHKNTFGIFEILKIEILIIFFFFFINVGPNARVNFKTLLLLQIAAKSFKTCLEFYPQWSSQNYVRDF